MKQLPSYLFSYALEIEGQSFRQLFSVARIRFYAAPFQGAGAGIVQNDPKRFKHDRRLPSAGPEILWVGQEQADRIIQDYYKAFIKEY